MGIHPKRKERENGVCLLVLAVRENKIPKARLKKASSLWSWLKLNQLKVLIKISPP